MSFAIWAMGAGAAHPNMYFKTFAFSLSPISQIVSLESIFSEPDDALKSIQEAVRFQLLHDNERSSVDDLEPMELDAEWVNSGTEKWDDLNNFLFTPEGIEFLFSPYQVAAYVYGPQFAKVSYEKVAKLMHRHFAFALGVEYLQHERLNVIAVPEIEKLSDGTDIDAP